MTKYTTLIMILITVEVIWGLLTLVGIMQSPSWFAGLLWLNIAWLNYRIYSYKRRGCQNESAN